MSDITSLCTKESQFLEEFLGFEEAIHCIIIFILYSVAGIPHLELLIGYSKVHIVKNL